MREMRLQFPNRYVRFVLNTTASRKPRSIAFYIHDETSREEVNFAVDENCELRVPLCAASLSYTSKAYDQFIRLVEDMYAPGLIASGGSFIREGGAVVGYQSKFPDNRKVFDRIWRLLER